MKYLLALLVSQALAQSPAPPPSPEMQALQNRVMQELNVSLQCSANNIALAEENKKLKERIEEKAKPDAK